MNTLRILTVTTCITGALGAQQADDALLFSTKATEATRSGTGGTSALSQLGPRSVAVVRPEPQNGAHSAEKFVPALAFQTLAGDEDGDGDAHTPELMTGVDAVLVKPYRAYAAGPPGGEWGPRTEPADAYEVYVSPIDDVGTNVSGAPGLRRGDCGRFVRSPAGNGRVEHFIRAEHIIESLGIIDRGTRQALDPGELNLDAITVSRAGDIFLSLEEDRIIIVQVGGGFATLLLEDGAVAWIPRAAWLSDARGNVQSVASRRGRIALSESDVDALVANAAAADYAGGCPTTIGDTDGLAIELAGGTFNVAWNGQVHPVPHLLFCGETLTGGGVLSTGGGGTIAKMNTRDLAAACGARTLGRQVGVADDGDVGSLDGLSSLDRDPCRFVLGSPTPTGLGGAIEVEIGHDLPVGNVFLLFGLGTAPVSPSIDVSPWSPNNRCFPEIYPAVIGNALVVPTPVHAFGDRAGTLGPVAVPFLPQGIVFQAAAVTPNGIELSTPVTIH